MNNDLKSYRSTRSIAGKKNEGDKILLMTLTDGQTLLTPNQSGSEIGNVSKKRLQLLNEVGGKTIPEEEAHLINDNEIEQDR